MKRFLAILALPFLAMGALLALTTSPASADDHARIHLLHGIPDTDVDVEIAGANAIEGFAFGDTEDLSSLAGQTLTGLKVKVAGTDTVAIDAGDVALPAEGNFTIVAHLDADGAPALAVFENDTSAIDAGNGRLVVRHAAQAPAVDILANGAVAFANVPNGAGGAADLAAGTIEASVVPAGAAEPVVIGPAELPINEGDSLTVYAVGSLDAGTLTVLTESITGLGTAPAAVNTGNSPINTGSSNGSNMPLIALAVGLGVVAIAAVPARRLLIADNGR